MKYVMGLLLSGFTTMGYTQSLPDTSKRKEPSIPSSKKPMRAFATDRPDVTESAYTVDAGHFQLETDLFKTEQFTIGGIKSIYHSYNVANIKLGISRSLDFQIVVGSFFNSKIKSRNGVIKNSGFGGLTLRAKQNIWGNDNGKTAFSILPFINIPTVPSEKISGGIIFPFALSLPHNWSFGAQLETDIEADPSGNNYHLNYLASATVSHPLFKNFDFFVEGFVTRDNKIKTYEYFLDGGIVYALTKNLNLDSGIYYGLKYTSSKTYFVGLSLRL